MQNTDKPFNQIYLSFKEARIWERWNMMCSNYNYFINFTGKKAQYMH
jgi:hypothetical protein